jgi:hypothetical protein
LFAYKDEPWYRGETLITGIGQGFMTTSPLQLAVATEGWVHPPRGLLGVAGKIAKWVKISSKVIIIFGTNLH